jgi:hypothetical protein
MGKEEGRRRVVAETANPKATETNAFDFRCQLANSELNLKTG